MKSSGQRWGKGWWKFEEKEDEKWSIREAGQYRGIACEHEGLLAYEEDTCLGTGRGHQGMSADREENGAEDQAW